MNSTNNGLARASVASLDYDNLSPLRADQVTQMHVVEIAEIVQLLSSVTSRQLVAEQMDDSSPLLGAIPELDSIGVVNLLVAMESRYGFQVHDDEVDQEIFATLGALRQFAQNKIEQAHQSAADGCL